MLTEKVNYYLHKGAVLLIWHAICYASGEVIVFFASKNGKKSGRFRRKSKQVTSREIRLLGGINTNSKYSLW